ncbi:MAG: hypothetical protein ABIP54_02285 [Candidatus Andersenbacteria bacterium]
MNAIIENTHTQAFLIAKDIDKIKNFQETLESEFSKYYLRLTYALLVEKLKTLKNASNMSDREIQPRHYCFDSNLLNMIKAVQDLEYL